MRICGNEKSWMSARICVAEGVMVRKSCAIYVRYMCDMCVVTCDRGFVTCDRGMWHVTVLFVTCDRGMWHVTVGLWHVDRGFVTCDRGMWHVTVGLWHVTPVCRVTDRIDYGRMTPFMAFMFCIRVCPPLQAMPCSIRSKSSSSLSSKGVIGVEVMGEYIRRCLVVMYM